jgi:APA family basic amino acid/polyamine antiporter
LFLYWAIIGLVVYFGYARKHSLVGKELAGD